MQFTFLQYILQLPVQTVFFAGAICIIGGFGCMLFALPYSLYPLEIQVGNETVPQLCREVDRNEIDCEEQTTAAANR